MKEYEFGQAVRLSAYYANAASVPTNPTTTTFQYGLALVNPPPSPSAVSAVFGVDGAVINDSAGRFHYDFVPSASGNYVYRSVGTGTVAAAAVGYFRVKPIPFAP